MLEVRNLKSVVDETLIYCTMDVNGGTKKVTSQVAANSPYWDTPAEFSTTNPTPVVKVKLFTDNTSMLALDDKELGKVVINPSPSSSKVCTAIAKASVIMNQMKKSLSFLAHPSQIQ